MQGGCTGDGRGLLVSERGSLKDRLREYRVRYAEYSAASIGVHPVFRSDRVDASGKLLGTVQWAKMPFKRRDAICAEMQQMDQDPDGYFYLWKDDPRCVYHARVMFMGDIEIRWPGFYFPGYYGYLHVTGASLVEQAQRIAARRCADLALAWAEDREGYCEDLLARRIGAKAEGPRAKLWADKPEIPWGFLVVYIVLAVFMVVVFALCLFL